MDLKPIEACEFEELILGCMMLEKDAVDVVLGVLKPNMLYDPRNELTLSCIAELVKENKPIDVALVSKKAREKKIIDKCGGAARISSLTDKVSGAANLEFWCKVVQEAWIKREMANSARRLISELHDDGADCFDLIDKWNAVTVELMGESVDGVKHLSEIVDETTEMITTRTESASGLTGITSGVASLDLKTGGWQKPNLTIIAGRPAMGKTSALCTFAKGAAESGVPALIFSLEMRDTQLAYRTLSQISQVNGKILARQKPNENQMNNYLRAANIAKQLPIYIDDTGGLSIQELERRSKVLVKKKGVGIIFIDYLQLLTDKDFKGKGNREGEVSSISRRLKALCKTLDVPIIALSQLSREVEKRSDRRPVLSDLRESGSLEQDSDEVIFLFRPEYYGITHHPETGKSFIGKCELCCAKFREGEPFDVTVDYVKELTLFKDEGSSLPPTFTSIPHPDGRIEANQGFLDKGNSPF